MAIKPNSSNLVRFDDTIKSKSVDGHVKRLYFHQLEFIVEISLIWFEELGFIC